MDGAAEVPFVNKQIVLALANLFMYSVAMFTLPFVAFFGIRHILTEYYPVSTFAATAWSVAASVLVVNIIIFAYAYKAYHEKEYDEQGNEVDQHKYDPLPKDTSEKSNLNLKQD